MYTNRKEHFHFQLSCGIYVCGLYFLMLSLDIILFATVRIITLSRNVSKFVGAAPKYLRRPCGEQ
jgi:hypothetical protein